MPQVVQVKNDYRIDSVQTGDLLLHVHIPSKPQTVDIVNYNDYYNSGEYNRHIKYRNLDNPDWKRYYYHVCGVFYLSKSPYVVFHGDSDILRPNRAMVEHFGPMVAQHNNKKVVNHVKNWRDKVLKRWQALSMADFHTSLAYEAEKIIEEHYKRGVYVKNFIAGGSWNNEECCSRLKESEHFEDYSKKCGTPKVFKYKYKFTCESNMGFSYEL